MNVIITGASRGIGFELSKLFSEKGHTVLALARDITNLSTLNLPKVTPFAFDLLQDDYSPLLRQIESWTGVDIIINNAGALVNKPFAQITDKELTEVYQINVFSPFRLVRDLLPYMSSDAHTVNISSIGGVQGSVKFPGLSAYSSSKGALSILTECLAQEFSETKLRFNALALGSVQTKMLEEAFPGYKAQVSPEQMAHYIYRFAVLDKDLYNGKVLSVSFSTP
jgi:NAD(P)-dependent dehydrogenase (short-subunit alcohol dehydrogenase family)